MNKDIFSGLKVIFMARSDIEFRTAIKAVSAFKGGK